MTRDKLATQLADRVVAVVVSVAPVAMLATLAALATVAAYAQPQLPGQGFGRGGGRASGPSDTDTREYDKRDFAGLWSRSPDQYQLK